MVIRRVLLMQIKDIFITNTAGITLSLHNRLLNFKKLALRVLFDVENGYKETREYILCVI